MRCESNDTVILPSEGVKGARGSAPDLPRRRADRVSAECTLKSVPAKGSDAGRWKEFSASAPLHAPGCAGRAARYCQTGRDGCSSSRTWVRGPRSEILSNRSRRMSLFTHLGARAAQRDIVKPVETDAPLHAPRCAGRAARYCQTGRDGCPSSRTWVRGPLARLR
jgi:hypothetical protein